MSQKLKFSRFLRAFKLQMELPYFYDVQKSPSNALEKVLCCFEFGCSGSSSYIALVLLPVSDSVSLGEHLPLKSDCEVQGGHIYNPSMTYRSHCTDFIKQKMSWLTYFISPMCLSPFVQEAMNPFS